MLDTFLFPWPIAKVQQTFVIPFIYALCSCFCTHSISPCPFSLISPRFSFNFMWKLSFMFSSVMFILLISEFTFHAMYHITVIWKAYDELPTKILNLFQFSQGKNWISYLTEVTWWRRETKRKKLANRCFAVCSKSSMKVVYRG